MAAFLYAWRFDGYASIKEKDSTKHISGRTPTILNCLIVKYTKATTTTGINTNVLWRTSVNSAMIKTNCAIRMGL